jgi:hypothetical protein
MLGLGRSDTDAGGEPLEAVRHPRLPLTRARFGHILAFDPESALAREERPTLVAPQGAA